MPGAEFKNSDGSKAAAAARLQVTAEHTDCKASSRPKACKLDYSSSLAVWGVRSARCRFKKAPQLHLQQRNSVLTAEKEDKGAHDLLFSVD